MDEVLSQTYGRPGGPGDVRVGYLRGLHRGYAIEVNIPVPGRGGKGGPPVALADHKDATFMHRAGAGGGRENLPIIDAFKTYAEGLRGTDKEPLCFLEPGVHKVKWPYETPTATIVSIGPGGGGGGGMGETLPGQDGEDGLSGATFILPTYVPLQRPVST